MKFCLLNSHLILVTTNVFIVLGFFFVSLHYITYTTFLHSLSILFCRNIAWASTYNTNLIRLEITKGRVIRSEL